MTATRPLRAPAQDGAIVVEPPFDRVEQIVRDNRQRLTRPGAFLFGQSLNELRARARAELLASSRAYLSERGEPLPDYGNGPLFMAGHQPELFHPGVWVKNFALSGMAHRHGGVAVNLIVDNDTAKSTSLRVPTPPSATNCWPHLQSIPYDRWVAEKPFEELAVEDEELFASFPQRVSSALAGWQYKPLLSSFWNEVLNPARPTPLLGERFTVARRRFERQWGCHNLEIPVSRVCQLPSFAQFIGHMLANLERFHGLYNESVRAYRVRHHLRSRNHPVPDLATEGDWREVPLWAWRKGQSRRGRLMAHVKSDQVHLRVGDQQWPTLPLLDGSNLEPALAAWRELEAHGNKVRSRALTNTLYARLFLCDVFVHGIGGGKYDELTDQLLSRFYELEAPRFMVLSGTLLLPLPAYPVTETTVESLHRQWRDLHYNPQRHLSSESLSRDGVGDWAAQKERRIREKPTTPGDRRRRFEEIRNLNRLLRSPLHLQEEETRAAWDLAREELQANAVLQRRDFAFCLYPEEKLRQFCSQFL
ncbi:MAG: hypothetical protein ACJ8FY_22690 [Gemmataceae bacterium]